MSDDTFEPLGHPTREQVERFDAGERIEGLAFRRGDVVWLRSGTFAGLRALVVGMEAIAREPMYRVEVEAQQGQARAGESALKLLADEPRGAMPAYVPGWRIHPSENELDGYRMGEPLDGVALRYDDRVQVLCGGSAGLRGLVLSVVYIKPEPVYQIELEGDHGYNNVAESGLKRV